jgi:hypothetical protein
MMCGGTPTSEEMLVGLHCSMGGEMPSHVGGATNDNFPLLILWTHVSKVKSGMTLSSL